jgi:hypothetical protein
VVALIEYDRRAGKLVRFDKFADEDRAYAERLRFEIEREYMRLGRDAEVVILEAASEDALRVTHGNYFYSIDELTMRARAGMREALSR